IIIFDIAFDTTNFISKNCFIKTFCYSIHISFPFYVTLFFENIATKYVTSTAMTNRSDLATTERG
ncbi:MAG: hypothetical protein FWG98_12265, partial [Candidatus Cloacimonetes bacterium]|nr:hypothetical protein [Candidatus Cloacimonadota bacterium]